MADVHSVEVRRKNMSAIRSKDTKPELLIRRGLHARGFRFRLHAKILPGRPDLVLAKYNAVIFVHGCFWHGHGCPQFRWPKTREAFWRDKIERNVTRDAAARQALLKTGWRVAEIWECALTGTGKLPADHAFGTLSDWLSSDAPEISIQGTSH